jgi:hypothetical protein
MPVCGIPIRQRANGRNGMRGRMIHNAGEARAHVKITDALAGLRGFRLKFIDDFPHSCGTADRRSGHNAYAIADDITDHGITLAAEPMLYAGIQYLVSDGVPAVGEYQVANE